MWFRAEEVQDSSRSHHNGNFGVLADGSVRHGWFGRERLGSGEQGE